MLFEQDDYESEEWHRHENIALNLPFYCNTKAINKNRCLPVSSFSYVLLLHPVLDKKRSARHAANKNFP